MKRLLLLIPGLMLTGCLETIPVKHQFPPVFSEIMVSCPGLAKIPAGTEKLSDIVSVVSVNYGEYHMCKAKVDAWINWYNEQKKIYEESQQ